jgi:DNA-binding IclR family transcriptional regulator
VTVDTRRRMTIDALADALGLGLGYVTQLVEELVADSLVERCGDGNHIRLTIQADRQHGRALRDLEAS